MLTKMPGWHAALGHASLRLGDEQAHWSQKNLAHTVNAIELGKYPPVP